MSDEAIAELKGVMEQLLEEQKRTNDLLGRHFCGKMCGRTKNDIPSFNSNKHEVAYGQFCGSQ
jgi:hypothetical protein